MNSECLDLETFRKIFIELLVLHALKKHKIVRGNNAPFMNKKLSKAFMTRAQLRNKYLKNPNTMNKSSFTKQKNYCTNLLRREKKKYYNDLDTRIFESNKKFWERVKPLFSEKNKLKESIRLNENGKIISDNKEVAEILNNYYIESIENLGNRNNCKFKDITVNEMLIKILSLNAKKVCYIQLCLKTCRNFHNVDVTCHS